MLTRPCSALQQGALHLARDGPQRLAAHCMPRAVATLEEARQLAPGAFCDDSVRLEAASAGGPLAGLTFAAKDLYDVRGRVTGFGNPTWRATHAPAPSTAPAVQACLDAGATCLGITHMDELAYSLNGENAHYGTPRNPACPDRIPGGSSSGSAAAVAAGAVDFALGSDTGGSVRVPASYCGIPGFRPTHGRVSLARCAALAPSYDTGGFFAASAETLRRVGGVLLDPTTRKAGSLRRWIVAKDAFACVESYAVTQALYEAVKRHKGAWDEALSLPDEVELGGRGGGEGEPAGAPLGDPQGVPPLDTWWDVFRVSQGAEVWRELGAWVDREKPALGPGTKERFHMASQLGAEEVRAANAARRAITARLDALLGADGVIMAPAAAGPAPRLKTPPAALDAYRRRLINLTSIAGLAGLPQVSLPGATVEGCPIGLGLIGPRGSDEALLELAERVAPLLLGP